MRSPRLPLSLENLPIGLRSFLGGVILLVLGLVGEYIGRIYMCINAAPQYVERSVIRRGDGE